MYRYTYSTEKFRKRHMEMIHPIEISQSTPSQPTIGERLAKCMIPRSNQDLEDETTRIRCDALTRIANQALTYETSIEGIKRSQNSDLSVLYQLAEYLEASCGTPTTEAAIKQQVDILSHAQVYSWDVKGLRQLNEVGTYVLGDKAVHIHYEAINQLHGTTLQLINENGSSTDIELIVFAGKSNGDEGIAVMLGKGIDPETGRERFIDLHSLTPLIEAKRNANITRLTHQLQASKYVDHMVQKGNWVRLIDAKKIESADRQASGKLPRAVTVLEQLYDATDGFGKAINSDNQPGESIIEELITVSHRILHPTPNEMNATDASSMRQRIQVLADIPATVLEDLYQVMYVNRITDLTAADLDEVVINGNPLNVAAISLAAYTAYIPNMPRNARILKPECWWQSWQQQRQEQQYTPATGEPTLIALSDLTIKDKNKHQGRTAATRALGNNAIAFSNALHELKLDHKIKTFKQGATLYAVGTLNPEEKRHLYHSFHQEIIQLNDADPAAFDSVMTFHSLNDTIVKSTSWQEWLEYLEPIKRRHYDLETYAAVLYRFCYALASEETSYSESPHDHVPNSYQRLVSAVKHTVEFIHERPRTRYIQFVKIMLDMLTMTNVEEFIHQWTAEDTQATGPHRPPLSDRLGNLWRSTPAH